MSTKRKPKKPATKASPVDLSRFTFEEAVKNLVRSEPKKAKGTPKRTKR